MDNNYLIFGINNTFIPTMSNDHDIATLMLKQLQRSLPHLKLDMSNAQWTVDYNQHLIDNKPKGFS